MLTHSEKLRSTLRILLSSELGEHVAIDSDGNELIRSPAIRIVPPQIADYIKMEVVEGRGIECLVFQDPRVEPSSQVDFEFYEVVLRQHNLNQPTTKARQLITKLFTAVKPMRQQQAQIKGETKLEQVFLEIPRYHNFDDPEILKKMAKVISVFYPTQSP